MTAKGATIIPPTKVPEWMTADADDWASDLDRSLTDGVLRRAPLAVSFVITAACDSHCKYCPYGNPPFKSEQTTVSLAELKEVLNDVAEMGAKRVQFAGGEPLLVPWLDTAVATASHMGMAVAIVSNGMKLTRERFRELASAGLSAFVISVDDALPDQHSITRGAFLPDALHWLRTEAGEKVWLGANITVSRNNQGRVIQTAEALRELGFTPQIQPVHVFESALQSEEFLPDARLLAAQVEEWITHGNLLNNSPEYLRGMPEGLDPGPRKKLRCLIPWTHLLIDVDGAISFCCRTPPIGRTEEGVASVWQGLAAAQERKSLMHGCDRCWLGLVDFWK